MSYADGSSGSRNSKALTGTAVAVLQVGLALALVNGFAVTIFAPDPPRNLPSSVYPTKPLPPDRAEPVPERSAAPRKDVLVADPIVPRATDNRVVVSDVPTAPTGPVTVLDPGPVMPSDPVEPPVSFVPKGVIPRGDIARWVTTEDYPAAELRAGHEGGVRFRLSIDAGGKVTGCSIVASSGFAGLDAATCRHVSRRARFEPARGGNGEATAGTYEGSIRWVIPRD